MLLRSIPFSLLFFAACAGGGGGTSTNMDGNPETTDIIKVTYIRFNYNPKTRGFVPEYRVMLSASWQDKFGNDPKEPFTRLFPRGSKRSPFLGMVKDAAMKNLLREMESKGLSKLPATKPEDVSLDWLAKLENAPVTDPKDPPTLHGRIITVGGDGWHKSYLIREAELIPELHGVFQRVEKEVIKMSVQYTVQVSTDSNPIVPREK